jgi:hypothetical protein
VQGEAGRGRKSREKQGEQGEQGVQKKQEKQEKQEKNKDVLFDLELNFFLHSLPSPNYPALPFFY